MWTFTRGYVSTRGFFPTASACQERQEADQIALQQFEEFMKQEDAEEASEAPRIADDSDG